MARLRLKNPTSRRFEVGSGERSVLDVAVSVPVPHLDGIYSYLNDGHEVGIASVVAVPFGGTETFGFVVGVRTATEVDGNLKRISKVIHAEPLFFEDSLTRYRRVAEIYGTSLFAVLSAAAPVWGKRTTKSSVDDEDRDAHRPSTRDATYLDGIFGTNWRKETASHLLVPIGITWERIAVSLFLASDERTLILVPTERMLHILQDALASRNVRSYLSITSRGRKSERAGIHQKLISDKPRLVIGTRGAALAPFEPEHLIIIDPGDSNFAELRSPYFRCDEMDLWSQVPRVVTISHGRDLDVMSQGAQYLRGKESGRYIFQSTSIDNVIVDLTKMIKREGKPLSVLISVNDKSYSSGLICASCRNRSRCDCGFPLHIPKRGAEPECNQCRRKYRSYTCALCGGARLVATKGGSEALAMSIAKSIKGATVTLSNSSVPKSAVRRSNQHDIVIATHGLEPRILDGEDRVLGYDVIVMIGGRVAFTGPSLRRTDRFRRGWARLLGFASAKKSVFLVDLEPEHPEFCELKRMSDGRGLEMILAERRELFLPPYASLVELSGDDEVLHKVRNTLLADVIFARERNEIFPVHNGTMIVRVRSSDRIELLQLLQTMTRLRSSKRLPRIAYRVDPEDQG